ncbi:MAG TPA: hypothetical protein VG269_22050 [Tepidisphaeraceae bacterium]|nr:hypothetical protein [Tepidisphaeraceae bacterium]
MNGPSSNASAAATAIGGAGGSINISQTAQVPSNGGNGGDASATATATNAATDPANNSVTVTVQATGGTGGFPGNFGQLKGLFGNGGNAALGPVSGVSTGGGNVSVSGAAIGGGGHVAGSVTLLNAVTGSTTGALSLSQTATGGDSFGGQGNHAGNANSSLTLIDTQAFSLTGVSVANGGSAGPTSGTVDTQINTTGGTATAAISLTGINNVNASATATGGQGASPAATNAGAGGSATLGTVFGASTNGGVVVVSGAAIGGNGGRVPFTNSTMQAGSGYSISLNNAVDGFTTGALTLKQLAQGGDAGITESGLAGVTGTASSTLVKSASSSSLELDTNATGGSGARGVQGSGGDGAQANAVSNGTNMKGNAIANASALAGTGGLGVVKGGAGGAGTASTSAIAYGNNVSATANGSATGGLGGGIIGNANTVGGNGGSASSSSTATVNGNGTAQATDTASGGGAPLPGNGGSALSVANASVGGGSAAIANSTAFAGSNQSQGFVTRSATGGNASATASATAGGTALASAAASASSGWNAWSKTGSGHTTIGLANANAKAVSDSGPAIASARASGVASPGIPSGATSYASSAGGTVIATAFATSQPPAIPFNFEPVMQSQAAIAQPVPALPSQYGDQQSLAFLTALPSTSDSSAALAGTNAVRQGFNVAGEGAGPRSNILGILSLGGGINFDTVSPGGPETFTATAELNVGTNELTSPQDLEVGLLTSNTFSGGFDSLRFQIASAGTTLVDQAFTSPTAASAYFNDNLLELGSINPTNANSLDLSFRMDFTGSKIQEFDNELIFGNGTPGAGQAAPEPGSLALLGCAVAGLLARRRSGRNAPKFV